MEHVRVIKVTATPLKEEQPRVKASAKPPLIAQVEKHDNNNPHKVIMKRLKSYIWSAGCVLVATALPIVTIVQAADDEDCPNEKPAYENPKGTCTNCSDGSAKIKNNKACDYNKYTNLVVCECNDGTKCSDDPDGNKATGMVKTPYSGKCSSGSCAGTAGTDVPNQDKILKTQNDCPS